MTVNCGQLIIIVNCSLILLVDSVFGTETSFSMNLKNDLKKKEGQDDKKKNNKL